MKLLRDSLTGTDGQFSGRKLSVFTCMMLVVLIIIAHCFWKPVGQVVWLVLTLLGYVAIAYGIVTADNIIHFRNGKNP